MDFAAMVVAFIIATILFWGVVFFHNRKHTDKKYEELSDFGEHDEDEYNFYEGGDE